LPAQAPLFSRKTQQFADVLRDPRMIVNAVVLSDERLQAACELRRTLRLSLHFFQPLGEMRPPVEVRGPRLFGQQMLERSARSPAIERVALVRDSQQQVAACLHKRIPMPQPAQGKGQ